MGLIVQGVMKILLFLDGAIYNFICWFFEIFMYLAKLNIFNNEDYESIVRRVYIILGVVMLFVLSYSLLKAVINPDEFAKGEKSFPNIIKNVVISLVIIVVLPTVFDVAYRVQAVILNSDVIGKLILNEKVGTASINNGGRTIATNVFRAFFSVNADASSGDYASDYNNIQGAVASAFDEVNRGESFYVFAGDYEYNGTEYNFPELVADNAINYTYIISSIAGAFVLWCVLLFCFDLGIRIVKLLYYQIIAPIAVVCRVIPGSKTKSIFPNWVKLTVTTFLEVFIRLFIMYLGVYLIVLIVDKFPSIAASGQGAGLDVAQRTLVKAFLIMGVVAFIRQAPKLIQEVFGFETGNMKLGLKGLTERAGNGGLFAAAGLIGGTVGGFGQRLRDARAAGRHGWRAGLSAVAGGIGGGRRAFMRNLGSHNVEDFRNNTTGGINDTLERGRRRDRDRAQFRSGTLGGSLYRARQFLGGGNQLQAFQRELEVYGSVNGEIDAVERLANEAISRAEIGNSRDIWQYIVDPDNPDVHPFENITMSRNAMQNRLQSLAQVDINHELANGPLHVRNFQGGEHIISNAEQWDTYRAIMQQQFDEADRALQHHVQGYMYAENQHDFAENMQTLENQVGEHLGGGTMARLNEGYAHAQNGTNIIGENAQIFNNMYSRINEDRARNNLPPLNNNQRIMDLYSYAHADNLHTNMQAQQTAILVQREALQRRQNAAGGGNNGNNH